MKWSIMQSWKVGHFKCITGFSSVTHGHRVEMTNFSVWCVWISPNDDFVYLLSLQREFTRAGLICTELIVRRARVPAAPVHGQHKYLCFSKCLSLIIHVVSASPVSCLLLFCLSNVLVNTALFSVHDILNGLKNHKLVLGVSGMTAIFE